MSLSSVLTPEINGTSIEEFWIFEIPRANI